MITDNRKAGKGSRQIQASSAPPTGASSFENEPFRTRREPPTPLCFTTHPNDWRFPPLSPDLIGNRAKDFIRVLLHGLERPANTHQLRQLLRGAREVASVPEMSRRVQLLSHRLARLCAHNRPLSQALTWIIQEDLAQSTAWDMPGEWLPQWCHTHAPLAAWPVLPSPLRGALREALTQWSREDTWPTWAPVLHWYHDAPNGVGRFEELDRAREAWRAGADARLVFMVSGMHQWEDQYEVPPGARDLYPTLMIHLQPHEITELARTQGTRPSPLLLISPSCPTDSAIMLGRHLSRYQSVAGESLLNQAVQGHYLHAIIPLEPNVLALSANRLERVWSEYALLAPEQAPHLYLPRREAISEQVRTRHNDHDPSCQLLTQWLEDPTRWDESFMQILSIP